MNKKSRNKLLVATAIIVAMVTGLVYYSVSGKGSLAYFKTVKQVKADKSLVGETIRIGGNVMPGTKSRGAKGLKFAVGEKGDQIWVVYNGAEPSTFGDNVQVIAEGELISPTLLKASTLVTKCPSKFETKKIGDAE